MSTIRRLIAAGMKGGYYLTYPFSSLIMHNSNRVRVVVFSGDNLLLQQSHFGRQVWSLPGGGISRGETALAAAVRETKEETGVILKPEELTLVGRHRLPKERKWPQMNITIFVASLSSQQEIKVTRPIEILEAQWVNVAHLPDNRSTVVSIALKLVKEQSL